MNFSSSLSQVTRQDAKENPSGDNPFFHKPPIVPYVSPFHSKLLLGETYRSSPTNYFGVELGWNNAWNNDSRAYAFGKAWLPEREGIKILRSRPIRPMFQ